MLASAESFFHIRHMNPCDATATRAGQRENATLFRPPTATRPALWLADISGRRAIIKDYRSCGALMRFFGRFLVQRERALYRLLSGLPGIPRCYGLISRHCLAVEYIPGKDCLKFRRGELPGEFFERLERLVAELHRRGIAHCDLKHRENIIVTPDFRPHIVDFAAALPRGSRWNILQRCAFRLFAADDLRALVKIRHYLAADGVPEEEWRKVAVRSPAERLVRRVRDRLRSLLRAMLRNRRAAP